MPVASSIEDALRSLIGGLSAVTAIGPAIRPYKIEQTDDPAVGIVLIEVEEETEIEDLDGLVGLVQSKVHVTAIAETFDAAWTLSESIRTNGATPSTGLHDHTGTTLGIVIQRCSSTGRPKRGYVAYEDGSDAGFCYVVQTYSIDYQEST
ncbi:MAG TPA: hypothetical protein VGH74_07595 [Planctomycetaceae bacterium]|jgi:hypothetical protein